MLRKLYINSTIIFMLLILNSCGGGGNTGSNGNLTPSNKYPNAELNVAFEAYNNNYSGVNESGIKIIDATPFNQRTIIVVRITNTLNYPIFNVNAGPMGGRGIYMWDNDYTTRPLSGDETPYNINYAESHMGYIKYYGFANEDVRFTKIVTPDWCGYTITQTYVASKALQPGQSCVAYTSIDWAMNYDYTESIDLPIGYGFSSKNPDFPDTAQYGIKYNSNWDCEASMPYKCLPIVYAPIKVGRWYVGESGYDFAGNVAGVVLANTETDGDYLFINSGKKIKVDYDANGVAKLDFNNLITCTGGNCYLYGGNISYGVATDGTNVRGLDTTNYYYQNNFPGGIYYPATKVSRLNYAPMPINEVIPNISEVRAIQPDGTLIGANSAGVYGCFNNDGTNFRPFADQLHGWKVGYGYSWNVTYGETNWIPVQSTNQQQYWKVIADNTGKCQLDTVNSFTLDAIMYSQEGYPGHYMTTPQITGNGVYAQYVKNGKRYLKFYKYPPSQN